MLEVEKEDRVGHKIMEPVSMEDPAKEAKGFRKAAILGSREAWLI